MTAIAKTKRIVAVGLGAEADQERVLLLLDGDVVLISRRAGLNHHDAELFAEGVLEGLRIASQGFFMEPDDAIQPLEEQAQQTH